MALQQQLSASWGPAIMLVRLLALFLTPGIHSLLIRKNMSLNILRLPDKYGRLQTVRMACILSLLGAGMQTGSQGQSVLFTGRAIGGVACGLIFTLCVY